MNSLLHIVPQLPPAIDGVGDYCWNLWKHWPQGEPDWQFLVARGGKATAGHWPQVTVSEFALSARALAAALERSDSETVVLHYVGYGFQPKGIPTWLPTALRQWRTGKANRRLMTMFHEMYARSSPLRSPFWVAPFARKIIRELAELSDAWITSCERYSQQLVTEFAADATLGRIIPIGSNIPAVARRNPEEHRLPGQRLRIAIFGLARTRIWALERHWQLLRALNDASLVGSITLLGKSGTATDERMWRDLADRIGPNIHWRKCFDLSANELSAELNTHDCGLLANEPDILTKSGVLAALATHGVIPIVSTPECEPLPESLDDAVVANDDELLPDECVAELGDDLLRQKLRTNILNFAAEELAWERIALQWRQVLQRFAGPGQADLGMDSARPPRCALEVPA